MKITVCAMLNNRHDERLERLLKSLTSQSTKPTDVIIADTSQDMSLQLMSQQICDRYGAIKVQLPSDTINKSAAFNACLEKVTTKYVLFTDVDMMFHNCFIHRVRFELDKDWKAFIQTTCAYLPPDVDYTLDWPVLVKLARAYQEPSRKMSPGACQASLTSWFRGVGGYDERFKHLGGMDDDMMVRARKDGLNNIWIEDNIWALHQWHERSNQKGMDAHLYTADPEVIAGNDS